MEILHFQMFLNTMLTITNEVASSAKKWVKNKIRKNKKKAQSKTNKIHPSNNCSPRSVSNNNTPNDVDAIVPSTQLSGVISKQYQPSDFELIRVIGQGGYGKVFLAKETGTNQFWAVKALKKDFILKRNIVAEMFMEKRVLALGSSFPYIPTLHSTFTSQSHVFYAMEYLSGGDLFFHRTHCPTKAFEIDRARFYAAEILAALQFLHQHGIIYRDLKTENVLLDSDGHCVLADFGLCCENIVPDGVPSGIECIGTVEFMSPEVVKRENYSFGADWWSFGILCYEMIFGSLPFNGNNQLELMESIVSSGVYFPPNASVRTKKFLTALLKKNPRERLGCMEHIQPIRKHPYFLEIDWKKLDRKELVPQFKPKVLHSADSSNFDTDYTNQAATVPTVDPAVLKSINQEVFEGFTSTSTSSSNASSSTTLY